MGTRNDLMPWEDARFVHMVRTAEQKQLAWFIDANFVGHIIRIGALAAYDLEYRAEVGLLSRLWLVESFPHPDLFPEDRIELGDETQDAATWFNDCFHIAIDAQKQAGDKWENLSLKPVSELSLGDLRPWDVVTEDSEEEDAQFPVARVESGRVVELSPDRRTSFEALASQPAWRGRWIDMAAGAASTPLEVSAGARVYKLSGGALKGAQVTICGDAKAVQLEWPADSASALNPMDYVLILSWRWLIRPVRQGINVAVFELPEAEIARIESMFFVHRDHADDV